MDEFYSNAQLIPDDYFIHAAKTYPSDKWVMPGSSICRGNYPSDYSILVKFLPPAARYSVTLLNISDDRNGLAITLDQCSQTVNITFGSDCPVREVPIPLSSTYDTRNSEWHRIGVSFSESSISVFGDCRGDYDPDRPPVPELLYHLPLDLTNCRVRPCDEDVNVHILQPTNHPSCTSDGEVRLLQWWLSSLSLSPSLSLSLSLFIVALY